jgi:hypothetical protein
MDVCAVLVTNPCSVVQVFKLCASLASCVLDGIFLGELESLVMCENTNTGQNSGSGYSSACLSNQYGYWWADCVCATTDDSCMEFYGTAFSSSCASLFLEIPRLVLAAVVIDAVNTVCILTVLIYASAYTCCPIKCGFEVSTPVSPEETAGPAAVYVQLSPQQLAMLNKGQGLLQFGVAPASHQPGQSGVQLQGQVTQGFTQYSAIPSQGSAPMPGQAPILFGGQPQLGHTAGQLGVPPSGPFNGSFLPGQTIPLWNPAGADARINPEQAGAGPSVQVNDSMLAKDSKLI